ncbi:fimbria/pilus periplasmic chaperone [Stenotrophomonas maltophilia]|uniref:Pilus assembly protein n=1 Tax=Stenotrophomonas maltophilia TaxID=40324 RepID=A0A4S2D612_STEMA|nr:fimbria/pilus periplasmic chaperone [Stenotrophomonas maltophilia]TGY37078.1 pilus assembly protein [Stenotrophomonas maltophilia]
MSKIPLAGALLLALLPAAPALANLNVHPMRVHAEAGKTATVRVHSQSPQPQYVQATVKRILHPATEDEQEVDEAIGSATVMAVTPGKFGLAGGGNRLVRIIPLQPVQEETAFRVYFEGVLGPDDSEPAVQVQGTGATLGVSLVWGVLVNVLPADGRVEMQLEGDRLVNRGTLRLGVNHVQDCDASGVCTSHEVKRSLYPGAAMTLPFVPRPGGRVEIDYRLSHAGYRDHHQTLLP